MTLKVGINGFGRIGRNYLRSAKLQGIDIDIVAINDLTEPTVLAHMLKYDSVHGRFGEEVIVDGDNNLVIDGDVLKVFSERDPKNLPWGDLGADIVIESTGLFRTREAAGAHLEGGAKKVLISAPGKEVDATIVMGVNDEEYDPENHHVVSMASCTTNSVAPMAKVLDAAFGIEKGLLTTVHAYTNDQGTQDVNRSDLRRARAAAINIIPTTTGAAIAATKVLPQLAGKLDGMAIRVPVADGSVSDLVVTLNKEVSKEDVNAAFKAAADGELKGVLEYSEDPLVSTDIVGNPHSCIFDSLSTLVLGDTIKVLGWYDNEWGYSSRLVDFTVFVGSSL